MEIFIFIIATILFLWWVLAWWDRNGQKAYQFFYKLPELVYLNIKNICAKLRRR